MDTDIRFSDDELDEETSFDKESRVAEISKYKKAAVALVDARQKRIQELKRLIENGEYRIDSGKIAEKILDRQLEDGIF